MKFPRLAIFALFASSSSFALASTEDADVDVESEVKVDENVDDTSVSHHSPTYSYSGVEPTQEPPSYRYIDISATYNILERPEYDDEAGAESGFIEFDTGETITLNYTLTNHEEQNITLFAVSGIIYTYPMGDIAANISVAAIEPLTSVYTNETFNFRQEVKFGNLQPGTYYLLPILHLAKGMVGDRSIMRVAAPARIFSISEPTMSFFSVSFLSVQLFLLVLIGGATYYFMNYTIDGRSKKKIAEAKAAKAKAKAKAEGKGKGKAKSKEWLPEQYKKEN